MKNNTKTSATLTTNWSQMNADIEAEKGSLEVPIVMNNSCGIVSDSIGEVCTLSLPTELDIYHRNLDQGVM
jgi:hypothetical protein